MRKKQEPIDLSVIVTAHSEGIILHKTLQSIDRAGRLLSAQGFTYEVIIHVDSPSADTEAYLAANTDYLQAFTIYTNNFKDAGAARNFSVKKAHGSFATFIDGDDLVSENWLVEALSYLSQNSSKDIVAHSEVTVEFGDTSSIVRKHGEIDTYSDSILSVFANRWNANLMTKRAILLDNPYVVDPEGFGFEDWHLNNSFIYQGFHNVLIPETAIFVRRKITGSRWAAHKGAKSVLRANPLLSFAHFRTLKAPSNTQAAAPNQPTLSKSKQLLKRYPRLYNKTRHYYLRFTSGAQGAQPTTEATTPKWLLREWRSIHSIEKQLFPTPELLASTMTYDTITPAHWETGYAYKRVVDALKHNSYDYILFVPWIIKGGADKFAISYANQIQAADPKKRVLVIATLPEESPWYDKLTADFLPFGQLVAGLDYELQMRVLEQLIENSGAQYLHIINSALAYDFARTHSTYLIGSNKHLVVTSFSQSSDDTGRVFGYSHTHVPEVYELCDFVTSDNQAVLDMWHQEYGFDTKKLLLHKPSIADPNVHISYDKNNPLRVLWAARIAPEKMPALVAKIGKELQDLPIVIDMYGSIDTGMDTTFMQSLPANVTYKNGFDGFFTLPLDTYHLFLYTSRFDGVPNVLLESGICGFPIIASAVGGIPELIEDTKTGLLITDIDNSDDYVKAIRALALDSTLRQKLGTNIRAQLLQEYSVDAQQKRTLEMLKKLRYI